MIGFQPYETFQLLIETGGVDRTNTLLCAACDAYAIRLREWVAAAHKYMLVEYFVKFAINPAGTVVLAVSCHT